MTTNPGTTFAQLAKRVYYNNKLRPCSYPAKKTFFCIDKTDKTQQYTDTQTKRTTLASGLAPPLSPLAELVRHGRETFQSIWVAASPRALLHGPRTLELSAAPVVAESNASGWRCCFLIFPVGCSPSSVLALFDRICSSINIALQRGTGLDI